MLVTQRVYSHRNCATALINLQGLSSPLCCRSLLVLKEEDLLLQKFVFLFDAAVNCAQKEHDMNEVCGRLSLS